VTALVFLYYALGIGFLILVGFISFAMYQVAQTVKSVRRVTQDIGDIAHDVTVTKDRLKLGVITSVLGIIRRVKKVNE